MLFRRVLSAQARARVPLQDVRLHFDCAGSGKFRKWWVGRTVCGLCAVLERSRCSMVRVCAASLLLWRCATSTAKVSLVGWLWLLRGAHCVHDKPALGRLVALNRCYRGSAGISKVSLVRFLCGSERSGCGAVAPILSIEKAHVRVERRKWPLWRAGLALAFSILDFGRAVFVAVAWRALRTSKKNPLRAWLLRGAKSSNGKTLSTLAAWATRVFVTLKACPVSGRVEFLWISLVVARYAF